jgi:hypothetical protein
LEAKKTSFPESSLPLAVWRERGEVRITLVRSVRGGMELIVIGPHSHGIAYQPFSPEVEPWPAGRRCTRSADVRACVWAQGVRGRCMSVCLCVCARGVRLLDGGNEHHQLS